MSRSRACPRNRRQTRPPSATAWSPPKRSVARGAHLVDPRVPPRARRFVERPPPQAGTVERRAVGPDRLMGDGVTGEIRPKLLRRVGRMALRFRKKRHNGEDGHLPRLPRFTENGKSKCHSRVGPKHVTEYQDLAASGTVRLWSNSPAELRVRSPTRRVGGRVPNSQRTSG